MARTPITGPKIEFPIIINKQKWIVRLYTKAQFEKKWKNCVAITEYDHKRYDLTINFKGPKVSRDTVAHELLHAYLSYKDYSHLKADTVEERFCEMIGKKYKMLYFFTEKVYSLLTRSRNELVRDEYFQRTSKKIA